MGSEMCIRDREECDDVQNVYTNMTVSDEVAAELYGDED